MQLYRQHLKTAHRALQRLFLRLYPLNRPRYQTDKSGYNTARVTLERITAPPAHTRYQRRAGRFAGQHSRPIIIMYIRGGSGAPPVMDPCQTVQHTADHANPAASRCFPRQAACNLAPGQPGTLHPAGQSINGARRAARNH